MNLCSDVLPQSLKCVIYVLVLTAHQATATVSNGDIPPELQACYNQYYRLSLRDFVGQDVCWGCEAPILGGLLKGNRPAVDASAEAYLKSLSDKMRDIMNGNKNGQTKKCKRREYRMLTDTERNKYHAAINTLKKNSIKYDTLARLHNGPVLLSAHGGPNFLGWHRVYLILYEQELQSVDPSICLPYWDSSLDSELPDPASSYVFSSDFLGGRGTTGPVTDGPFAGWKTDSGSLSRSIGDNGDLYNQTEIDYILSRRRTRDITPPNGMPQYGLEFHHNGVHNFIGGQMSRLSYAAHDPIFFLHHAFVDYIWEVFRTSQRSAGIDPQRDYPQEYGSPRHAPDRQMDGFNWTITALDGFSDGMTATYEYEATPTCSIYRPSCGSGYLRCNFQKERCVPTDPTASTGSGEGCGQRPLKGVQNSFCIDGVCDTRGWVYVPVQVVSKRPPEFDKFDSYPVYNGSIEKNLDIYQVSANSEAYSYVARDAPKGYDNCDDGKNDVGQVFIQSEGMTYDGFYKESVIIDQRLATSIAVGFVAVKDPRNSPVKALFRAFDSCGRICHTACRIPGTDEFEPCTGALDIEDIADQPKQYSQTYGAATLNTWGYTASRHCPSFHNADVMLTFYCAYNERVPWAKRVIPRTMHMLSPVQQCVIDTECTIDVPCGVRDTCNGERYKCRRQWGPGRCNMFIECRFGFFWKWYCPDLGHEQSVYECVPRHQCNSRW